jgi:hypothetical protein
MTNPYNPVTNPENVLISLYLTPYINIQTGIDIKVSPSFDITLNGNFMHSSNAATNMPNYGINEATAILGLRYHFNKSAELPSMWKKHADTLEKFKRTNALFASIEPGFLWARFDDYYYWKNTFQIGYQRQALAALSFGVSLDITHAIRLAPSRDVDNIYRSKPLTYLKMPYQQAKSATTIEHTYMPKNIVTLGAYAFGEVNFGRFAFHVGVGGYFYKGGGPNDGAGSWFNRKQGVTSIAGRFDLSESPSDEELQELGLTSIGNNGGTLHKNPWIFEKIGFRIELGKKRNHFVGAYIRAHMPVADYLAFQYGYKFYIKRTKKVI